MGENWSSEFSLPTDNVALSIKCLLSGKTVTGDALEKLFCVLQAGDNSFGVGKNREKNNSNWKFSTMEVKKKNREKQGQHVFICTDIYFTWIVGLDFFFFLS